MEPDKYATVTMYLYAKNLIFDYASKFYSEHKSIDSAQVFRIDDNTYHDFMQFVKDKKFTYTTESEKKLAELRKSAKEEGYLEKIEPELKQLEEVLAADKKNDLLKNRSDIEDLMSAEIVGRYYYQVGRIVWALKKDPELKRAFDILLNAGGKDEYGSILKP